MLNFADVPCDQGSVFLSFPRLHLDACDPVIPRRRLLLSNKRHRERSEYRRAPEHSRNSHRRNLHTFICQLDWGGAPGADVNQTGTWEAIEKVRGGLVDMNAPETGNVSFGGHSATTTILNPYAKRSTAVPARDE